MAIPATFCTRKESSHFLTYFTDNLIQITLYLIQITLYQLAAIGVKFSLTSSKIFDSLSKNPCIATMATVPMKVLGALLFALCLVVPLISASASDVDVKYCGKYFFYPFFADSISSFRRETSIN